MKQRPFLALWTLAVAATVAAFVLHLALRGRTVDLGYKLGRARAEQARLREIKRVLSLEAASHQTPQRVEMVARTLLGMTPPPPERVIPLKAPVQTLPPEDRPAMGEQNADITAVMKAATSASASAAAAAPGAAPPASATAPPVPRAPSKKPPSKPKQSTFSLPSAPSDDPYGDPAGGGIGNTDARTAPGAPDKAGALGGAALPREELR